MSRAHLMTSDRAGRARLLGALALLCLPAAAHAAAEPVYAFEPGAAARLTEGAELGWHKQFEDDGDYGETWFFMVHTDEGGVLFASVSITNLGMRTFDGVYELRYYAADG